MKTITFVASLAAATLVAAAPPTYRIGNSRVSHSCDLELNVVDPDPLGPNVHVVGQAGAWFLIDRAVVVDDAAPDGEREVFRGGGWMHSSTLGFSELMTGEGTLLREAPRPDARVVRPASTADAPSAGPIRVIGCRGKFIKVDLGDIAPWTDTWCNNERTTCS